MFAEREMVGGRMGKELSKYGREGKGRGRCREKEMEKEREGGR